MQRLDCPDLLVTITAPVRKMCPVVNEVDEGTATIRYRTFGLAWELHALAAYLASFADRPLSHEDCTAEIAGHLNADVTTSWTTAGMEVTCAFFREPVNAEGA